MSDDRYDASAVKLLRDDSVRQEGLAGCYRGIVESIDDPDRIGRVRVRVFALHGDKQRVPTTALPWADVSEVGGGGHDYGGFNPPIIGSTVFVMFEMGYAAHPVLIGTWRGTPVRDEDNPHVMLASDGQPTSETSWKPPDDVVETPKDVFDGVSSGDPHPTRQVFNKSYKGHTFIVENGDGVEFLKIIDRSGQMIVMDCPVQKRYSKGNAAQRGVRDAMRGDQLPHQVMRQRRASIRIVDLSGQEILLDAADQNERIVIRSSSRDTGKENKIVLSSGKGKESCSMVDSAGNYIKLDPNSDYPIQLRDTAGNAIYTDKEKGQVVIVAAKEKVSDVPRESKTVQGTKSSEIRGDEKKTIHGNKKTDIVGDLATGVMSSIAANVGGAVQLVIANVPGGIPAPLGTALDISVTQGDTHLNHLLGNILLDTIAGDVEMSTLAGDVSLVTLAGAADIGNLLASTSYSLPGAINSSAVLNHDIDGLLVRLGGVAATNPLIKTLTFMPAWLAATVPLGAAGSAAMSIAAVPTPITNAAAIQALGAALVAYTSVMSALLLNPAMLSLKTLTA